MKYLFIILYSLSLFTISAQSKFNRKPTVDAALDLLSTYTPSQKTLGHFAFTDTLRTSWSNLPMEQFNRKGLWLRDMTDSQRLKIHALLRTVLSAEGYQKAILIMQSDEGLHQRLTTANNLVLARIYGEDKYFTTFFGEPNENKTWSFRFEGHHLSLNFSFSPVGVSCTPMFTGVNPALITSGIRAGQYILSEENEIGCELFNSLSNTLKIKALISVHPKDADVMTRTGKESFLKSTQGVSYKEFSADQKNMVKGMVRAWVENLTPALAKEKTQYIEKHLKDATFTWMGTNKTTELHYFRLYSPDFIIEFTNRDGGIYHYHSLWRNLGEEQF